MQSRNLTANIPYLKRSDEVKFVIGNREDYLWSKEQIEFFRLHNKVGTILMSPVSSKISLPDLAQWILEDKLPVRFQVQLHKIIWPEVARGV